MANSRFLASIALAATVACSTTEPIAWNRPLTASGEALPGRLVIEGDSVAFTTDTATLVAPQVAGACAGSVRVALSGQSGAERYVTWWAPRPDSSAALLAARSTDGGQSWSTPEPVDTADHTPVGCKRPAPAIAADSASGYVHVAFALLGREGPGLFYAHSMDGGAMFHAAVPILYGDRLGRASVAADGDVVVVAFEDPNSRAPRIGLALSHTMGHIFEDRLMPISDDNESAWRPLVAVQGRRLAVAWLRGDPSDDRPDALAVRTGTLR